MRATVEPAPVAHAANSVTSSVDGLHRSRADTTPRQSPSQESSRPDRKRPAERAPVGVGLLGPKKKKTGKAAKTASSLIDKWQAVRKVRTCTVAPPELQPLPQTLAALRSSAHMCVLQTRRGQLCLLNCHHDMCAQPVSESCATLKRTRYMTCL